MFKAEYIHKNYAFSRFWTKKYPSSYSVCWLWAKDQWKANLLLTMVTGEGPAEACRHLGRSGAWALSLVSLLYTHVFVFHFSYLGGTIVQKNLPWFPCAPCCVHWCMTRLLVAWCYVGVGLPTGGGTIISHPFLMTYCTWKGLLCSVWLHSLMEVGIPG